MKGFQITFFTEQDRRQGHQQVQDWLMDLAKAQEIGGVTVTASAEGIGHRGKLHSAHLVMLTDQPIEVTMIVSDVQAAALFASIADAKADLFYVKIPVEYGRTVTAAD